MRIESLKPEQAIELGMKLPFALVRSMSEVTLGKVPKHIDPAQLMEARFFDRDQEIRVFRGEDGLRGARLCQEPDDRMILEEYRIENQKFGREITVCLCLDSDEDGQTYVSATRLADWKEGAK